MLHEKIGSPFVAGGKCIKRDRVSRHYLTIAFLGESLCFKIGGQSQENQKEFWQNTRR